MNRFVGPPAVQILARNMSALFLQRVDCLLAETCGRIIFEWNSCEAEVKSIMQRIANESIWWGKRSPYYRPKADRPSFYNTLTVLSLFTSLLALITEISIRRKRITNESIWWGTCSVNARPKPYRPSFYNTLTFPRRSAITVTGCKAGSLPDPSALEWRVTLLALFT